MDLKRILIVGGYGNFGRMIAKTLAKDANIELIIAGRHINKAQQLIKTLVAINPIHAEYCDINTDFVATLKKIAPFAVIHTSGPFQNQPYTVALACIEIGCHYIDLADSREFVAGIHSLHNTAKEKNIFICSGASSVPGLSSALINHYQSQFKQLETVDYAIATAQLTNQGLATTAGVLSYAGKPFKSLIKGTFKTLYGWQNLRKKLFWQLPHTRLLGNCDIPDLALFPSYYPQLKTIHFQAGLELKGLQFMLYLLSGMVRYHLFPSLDRFAAILLKISHLFDRFGHNDTGFYMELTGRDHQQKQKTIRFDIKAEQGDGLYIPCIPAIVLTQQLISQSIDYKGAFPCIGLVSLDDYLNALKNLSLAVKWQCYQVNKETI